MSLIKSGIIVAVFTFLSRVSGYIRDILMAAILGASDQADAFAVAFKLPNFFRTIFAEGAFSAAFVPKFTAKIAKHGDNDAKLFAQKCFINLLIVVLCICLLLMVFMPQVMTILAPGFKHLPQKFDLVIKLAYFTTPYLLFVSLSTLQAGVLNSYNRFAAGAAMSIVLNVFIIMALIIYPNFYDRSHDNAAMSMSYGVLLAGFIQYGFIFYYARLHAIDIFSLKYIYDDEVKSVLKTMLPAIIGSGVVQLNLWVGTIIASEIDKAVSYLYYAERLNQFPLAIIGTTIATVILPKLSKQITSDDKNKANFTQNRALEFSLFLCLPCAVAFISIGDDIIKLLFERHAFSKVDTFEVYKTLSALAFGLPAFVLGKVLISRFFAESDTKTPLIISFIAVSVNIVINLILIDRFAHVGIAIGTSVASWVQVFIAFSVLLKRRSLLLDKELIIKVPKIIIANIFMYLFLANYQVIFPMLKTNLVFFNIMIVIIISGVGYLSCTALFAVFDYKLVLRKIFRKNND